MLNTIFCFLFFFLIMFSIGLFAFVCIFETKNAFVFIYSTHVLCSCSSLFFELNRFEESLCVASRFYIKFGWFNSQAEFVWVDFFSFFPFFFCFSFYVSFAIQYWCRPPQFSLKKMVPLTSERTSKNVIYECLLFE